MCPVAIPRPGLSGFDVYGRKTSASSVITIMSAATPPTHTHKRSGVVRFEIEQGLMDGSIAVKDVPAVWASKMKELLGVDVPGDAEGCLQDIHW